MAMGPARFFFHSPHPKAQETLLPFIARLSTDPIFQAQRPKVLRPQRSQHKLYSLLHRFTLLPGHERASFTALCPKSVTYVLNLEGYRCSEPAPFARDRPTSRVRPN